MGPISHFDMGDHTANAIAHVKFQVDRSKGLEATDAQNRVFPIDFDRRPYNSVMHYGATMWYNVH